MNVWTEADRISDGIVDALREYLREAKEPGEVLAALAGLLLALKALCASAPQQDRPDVMADLLDDADRVLASIQREFPRRARH